MQTHNLRQGTPEWHAYRATHFNASDAAAMMGASPHKTRSQLLHELHTGLAAEPNDYVEQRVLAPGHAFEASSRGLAEELVGEDLFPVVGSLGRLSASFDGLTMSDQVAWEHKRLNDELRACFRRMESIAPEQRERAAGIELPLHHRIQMEQQLHVSGAERELFTASEWTDAGDLVEAAHCWYYPDAELRAQILRGWEQFAADLAAYVPPAAVPVTPTGRAPEALPALRIEVTGQVTTSNLDAFKRTALTAIRSVKRELSTDQDFADAEASVKWCEEVETRLAAAKQHALSQTASIDALFRAIDEISAEARRTRLDVDKLVKARKEAIRGDLVADARRALQDHAQALTAECAPASLDTSGLADFAGAIRGKRTIATLRDACDTELARARITLDDQARRIRANLAAHRTLAAGREFLFPDLGALAHKAADDFAAALRQRIADHEAKEAARVDADRARIRAEEQAKAQREADERARAEAQQAEARARIIAMASPAPAATPATAAPAPYVGTACPDLNPSSFGGRAPAPARAPAAPANEPATLKLGTLCERLAPIAITAAGLEQLGFPPAAKDGAARLWRESDFPRICAALTAHVQQAAARDWRAAA